MASKTPQHTRQQQSQSASTEGPGRQALSYPTVIPAPVQLTAAPSSQAAVIQRRVGIEVETGVPVYKPLTVAGSGIDPNLLGLLYQGAEYSRNTRGNLNGVELHADSGGSVYGGPRDTYFKDRVKNRVRGVPDKLGKASIIEAVTSKQGLVDELGPNGKQDLSDHLDELLLQIANLENAAPTALGNLRAGVDNNWGYGFKDAMLKNGYFPQVNIGIDLGGLAGMFKNPVGGTLTSGFFWGGVEARDTHADIAAVIGKAAKLPIEEGEDDPVMPHSRLLNSLEGVLTILLSYFKGARAGHNPTETEKNSVPFMLKGSFQSLWEELLKQFPEEQRDVEPKEWFMKISKIIETELDAKYKLQSLPAARMGGYSTLSAAFEALINGENIGTSIASGEKVKNDEEASINYDVADYMPELMLVPDRKVPVVELRHMDRVGSGDALKNNIMMIVEGVIERQLEQFDGKAIKEIKERSGW
ncbi:hypothetical protein [Chitinophaga silvisoli]|uniref:Uncharacterized protein n=1 Tax=Chitinophaga silvisoli TaxID=2291814 RepID=A0A3E1NUL2_9BACT|nr:hypothetical protein [Chitinophaga silvisoli]RFM31534.1 hypothetical protein DXN04_27860 [Chitinophaga silvisoli]